MRSDISRLYEVSKHKNTIMQMLINDENIVKAIGNNESNFLDITYPNQTRELLFNNIFPYPFVPDIEDEQKTYITLSLQSRSGGKYYKVGSIIFYVFTHYNLLKTDYPEIRTDYLMHKIDSLFHESDAFGIGELQFVRQSDLLVTKSHYGVLIEYRDLAFD
jgi:hypothetical protein